MNITFVIESLVNGGAERVVSLLSKEMARQGNTVSIITFKDDCHYSYGGKLYCLNLPMNSTGVFGLICLYTKRAIAIRKLALIIKPDKVFSFMEVSSIISICAFIKPLVCIRTHPGSFTSKIKFIIRLLYPFSRAIICNSQAQMTTFQTIVNHPSIHTIYNPIDFELIDQLKDNPCYFKRPFILSAGRLVDLKRFDLLIQAYALSECRQYADLMIIGSGEKEASLKTLCKDLGISDFVIFQGSTSNPFCYMKRCLFFVLTSDYEGFPNVLAEALACGAAVISTDCPTGPSELIKDGYNGILVPTDQVRPLAQAMTTLCNNPDLRTQLKNAALPSVSHLQLTQITNQFLKI